MSSGASFLLFNEQWPAISILNDEQRGKLLQAFFHEGGSDAPMPELDQATMGIFLLIQQRIRENREKYQTKCLQNKANGFKGGRPKNPKKPNGFFQNLTDTDTDTEEEKKSITNLKSSVNNESNLLLTGSASASPDAGQSPEKSSYFTKRKRKLTGKRLEAFNRFWTAFAYSRGKAEAADAWLDIPQLTDSLVEQIVMAAEREAAARPGIVASGHSPKWAQGWISGRRWEDDAIPQVPEKNLDDYLREKGLMQ